MSRRQSPIAAERPVRVDFRNRSTDSAVVFVHGFGGHAQETWGDFPRFVLESPELDAWDVYGLGYSSNLRFELARVWSADARLDVLGYYLRTALGLPPLDRYKRIALVTHSMGGLVAQQALLDEQCRSRISHLFLFGTPNAGLAKAGLVRSLNQQVADVTAGSPFITKLRADWSATFGGAEPFVLHAIAGERDAFVPTDSSLEPFPEATRFVVPGDHLSMVRPANAGNLSVVLVVKALTVAPALVATPRNNLPRQLSRFIGRGREIATIQELLHSAQLVTIAGAGGIGKTRTALEAASGFLSNASDGVWFVDLAPLADPDLVPSAIAAALNIEDKGGSLLDAIVFALYGKDALLILDNCEHLLQASAQAADEILSRCPSVRMLVTTREALGIAGEMVFRMPTLSLDEGVALFAERAKASDSSFALTDDNRRIVEEIVTRLDGIALAIELAAPRVKVLPVRQLANRLDQRLNLLSGGSRTAMPRQQTLRALIGWSYDLLSESERLFLRQSAVFRAGFTMDAASRVCQPTSDLPAEWDEFALLASLIDKSLIVTESGENLRYRLLESTREYAFERLVEAGELEIVSSRHCCYFAGLASIAYDAVWDTNLNDWLTQTREELENYRAAVDWGILQNNNVTSAVSIVANLLHLWDQSLCGEGRRLIERAQASVTDDAPSLVRGRLLLAFETLGGRDVPASEFILQAVEVLRHLDDATSYADALRIYGRKLIRTGDTEKGIRYAEQALEVSRSLSHARLTARILASLGVWHMYAGSGDQALCELDESVTTLRNCNDKRRLIIAIGNKAEIKFAAGDVTGAVGDAYEGIAIARELEAEFFEAATGRANLAAYLIAAGDLTQAWTHAREAVQIALRVEARRTDHFGLQHLAYIAALTGDVDRSARILGFVDAALANAARARETTEQTLYERLMEMLANTLPKERATFLFAQGAACTEAAIIADAMAIPQPRPAEMDSA